MTDATREELLISVLADMLAGDRHVAVGAASPIPGAAALLAKAEKGDRGGRMQVSIIHSRRDNPFTDGARELFDVAGRGGIDSFFLGGVQIDGQANINLVGTGEYPRLRKRFPGSFGSALMYYVVPKVILFREEHSKRTLVEKVDFVSAPGVSPPGVHRPGGPHALVTGKAVFGFDRAAGRFRLERAHPGETAESIREATGFDFDMGEVIEPPAPSAERLARIRGPIADRVHQFYPEFASRIWGVAA
ncbi:MAG TPA: CoA-transferase [Paracoccaceae bacterium]|nr:CoA-transferase [Paracoccaceae bacterium]